MQLLVEEYSCLSLAGAKITKLSGEHCHISSILATKGLLWLGTSLGITLVYRIPCLEGVPLISGRPYLAYDAHQDSIRVLLSMTVSSRPVKQCIGSRVLREHVRKMNRPISAITEDDRASRERTNSPISDLSFSGNITCSNNHHANDTSEVFDNLSKESKDVIAQEVIGDLMAQGKFDAKSKSKNRHDYDTLSWIGPPPNNELTEFTASEEGISQHQDHRDYDHPPVDEVTDERRGSGDYETVEYPEDGHAINVHNDLYTPMHPRHYSMSIPGKGETITPPTEDLQLVVTAGSGLTHFRKLRSRTIYHQSKAKAAPAPSVKKSKQGGYLIVYELDSTLRMFNPEDTD